MVSVEAAATLETDGDIWIGHLCEICAHVHFGWTTWPSNVNSIIASTALRFDAPEWEAWGLCKQPIWAEAL